MGFYILSSLKEFGPQILILRIQRALATDSAYYLRVSKLLLHNYGYSTKQLKQLITKVRNLQATYLKAS